MSVTIPDYQPSLLDAPAPSARLTGVAYAYETQTCGRCGGTGHYSYNLMDGSRCYGCGGSGKSLTRRGAKSREAVEACKTRAYATPLAQISAGDTILSYVGITPTRRWVRVQSVTTRTFTAEGREILSVSLNTASGAISYTGWEHTVQRLDVTRMAEIADWAQALPGVTVTRKYAATEA